MYLKRPRFEVLAFPASELEAWSLYFSINDNGFGDIKPDMANNDTGLIDERPPEQLRESFKGIIG